ncbi:protein Star [Procambarus clarkii]|uniref:protein Star n=1 Tax=Procambarus clarkii TaxID=6728 RepID=UPI003743B590
MVRAFLTERQQSRVLTTWLTGLTLATVMHLLSPRLEAPQCVVLEEAEGGPAPSCNATNSLPTFTNSHSVVEALLEGPLEATDRRLLQWVAEGGGGRVFPPSTLPYNITDHNVGGWEDSGVWKFYVKAINRYFGKKEGGFFVEAGALDGVILSATLTLEQNQGWQGLLVEPRPDIFQQLLDKHRKAHAARFCLSEKPYPHQTSFWLSPDYFKQSVAFSAVSSQLLDKTSPELRETGNVMTVHCIPLVTLLRALRISHVDLFVLDVEGAEWGVIELFPFDQITVNMLAVERKKKGDADRAAFIQLVQSKGFTLAHSLSEDFIFIRNSSQIDIDPALYLVN